ncbi:pyridoxamine 5'-phosphate oxidase [Altererythrobacter sp. Z27]|uniref:pyridoxamine 5'-phosphate oxidase n=1 Tax=Altererythrobacter sp. Z27 TaxID=3461147 RepID=UPI0040447442
MDSPPTAWPIEDDLQEPAAVPEPTADQLARLASSEIPEGDPLALFEAWFEEAKRAEPNDANAMALATATPEGAPSVRMVLLKGHGSDGFTFYTNADSRKGREIRANMQAALLFHWKSLRRQIRIEGPLTEVSGDMADAYFHSRPFVSQVGSAASDQSRPLDSRSTYIHRVEQLEDACKQAGEVPRPPHWTGFTLAPTRIEFWRDRANRLHDRRQFNRVDGGWTNTLLYP